MSDIIVKPSLLLHICCAGCGVFSSMQLAEDYDVTLYFYNPNIFPKSEYELRLSEIEKIAEKHGLRLIVGDYDHSGWLAAVRGHEADPERGERCLICYRERLTKTAALTQEKNYSYFTTTLTVSPHKSASAIMAIGEELAHRYRVKFLSRDFKKRDGFKQAACLSRELGLYRQNYCGCEYSRRS